MPKQESIQTVQILRPLTAKELEQQKKIKNRISAIQARKRKKERLEELEAKVQVLIQENKKLKSENAHLLCNGKHSPEDTLLFLYNKTWSNFFLEYGWIEPWNLFLAGDEIKQGIEVGKAVKTSPTKQVVVPLPKSS